MIMLYSIWNKRQSSRRMSVQAQPATTRSPKQRSALANGSRQFLRTVPGITEAARQYKSVLDARHDSAMSDTESDIHPYTLEILPPKEVDEAYDCATRMHGKPLQHSDRSYPSKAKAQAAALATVEKALIGADR